MSRGWSVYTTARRQFSTTLVKRIGKEALPGESRAKKGKAGETILCRRKCWKRFLL